MSNIFLIKRLDQDLRDAGIPIDGIAILNEAAHQVRIDFKASATPAEITQANSIVSAFDWTQSAQNTWQNLQDRLSAKGILTATDGQAKIIRAVADIIKDELNILRAWITDFKADVAAATSLADLKTRVAANADLPDRTLAQLKTAINNRVDSGSVDS